MKILLLNENPMVSRLINLSAKKMSYELTEVAEYSEELGTYDTIIVDNDIEVDLVALKEKCNQLIFLSPRDKPCEVDAEILHKPFLPTDFLNLLSGESVKFDGSIPVEPLIEDNAYENMNFNLDDLNLEDLPDDNADDLSLESLSLDENEQAAKALEEDLSLEEDLDSETLENAQTSENLEAEQNLQSQEEVKTEAETEILQNETPAEVEISAQTKDFTEELKAEAEISVDSTKELEAEELTLDEELSEAKENLEAKEPLEELEAEIPAETKDSTKEFETEIEIPAEISQNEIPAEAKTPVETEIEAKAEIPAKTKQEQTPAKAQEELSQVENAELPQVEEKEIDFDDLPKDAEFLGQEKETPKEEDFVPLVEEELPKPKEEENPELSTQDQIKEELAALDEIDALQEKEPEIPQEDILEEVADVETEITPEDLEIPDDQEDGSKVLEEFKDEPILSLNEEKLGIDEEVVVPDLNELSDFDALKESEIQRALGEEVSEEEPQTPLETQDLEEQNLQSQENLAEENEAEKSEEIVNELSHSIAQSIKDDTLKAALKGMNMNINIKISFDEDKN